MKIKTTRNYGVEELKIIVYGPSGSGKTSLAKTCKNSLVISCEAGLLPLRNSEVDYINIMEDDNGQQLPRTAEHIKDDGSLIHYSPRLAQLRDALDYLKTDDAKKKYDWVFLDSLTEIGQILSESLKKNYPEAKMALPMWGEYAEKMRSLVKEFRDLSGFNVVLIALSSVEKDENSRRYQGIDVQGKISTQMPALFDEVFYYHTYTEEGGGLKRVLITQPNEKVLAKDRSGSLDEFEEPNLSLIADKIRGSK